MELSVVLSVREVIRPFVSPPRVSSDEVAMLAREIAAAGAGTVRAALFFGSRKSGAARSDPFSAFDLFVVVGDYSGFYRGLREAGRLRRPAALVAGLNAWLPPNQVSFRHREGLEGKLSVLSEASFLRETSAARRDHFCAGRLFQAAELVFSTDSESRELALLGLAQAHAQTLTWCRPWLPPSFDAAAYTRRLLEVSLAHEIRPEPKGRAGLLFDAQREYLVAVYGRLLETWAAEGALVPADGGRYSLATAASAAEKRRLLAYFARSKRRATLRWLKYMVTFEDWLEYIRRKAERHTGRSIALTERERRWPLLFLWPRVFRYLRDKDQLP